MDMLDSQQARKIGRMSLYGEQQEIAGLVAKMATVMDDIEELEKKGFNEFYKYSYARAEDIFAMVRKHLSKQKIMAFSNIESMETREVETKKGVSIQADVDLSITFIDGDSGASITVFYMGSGIDNGDKYLYKAYTGALKYALKDTFLMSAGDDVEEDSPERAAKTTKKQDDKAEMLRKIRNYYRKASPSIVEEVIAKHLNGKKIQEITGETPEAIQKILREIEKRLDEEYQESKVS